MENESNITQKKVRVLVVEDNPVAAVSIQQVLKKSGFAIAGCAGTGAAGLEMACTLKPDVILMDIMLPGTDGLEAARLVNEKCPAPVVVLTGYETPELIEKAGWAGVAAYLVKPPKANDLERAIYLAMERFKDLEKIKELNRELRKRNSELEEALGRIETLHGLLPICASCKSIRDDNGYWNRMEEYISSHADVQFSHGICPECTEKLYPGVVSKYKKTAGS
ncbi:MAG: response regulator [Proteobacteria bacterium]|nr:response regulator [Pseudomonadota bacterium]MBU1738043.1 response regulator [Pseudomonadota bacterium]